MKSIASILTIVTIVIFSNQLSAAPIGEVWTCVQNLACDEGKVIPASAIQSIKASSTLKDKSGSTARYDVKNLLDGKEGTAWCEGESDAGIGEGITVKFNKPTKVAGVLFSPGYAKSMDTFANNNRIKTFTIQLSKNKQQMKVKRFYWNAYDGGSDPKVKGTEIASPQLIMLTKPVVIQDASFIIDGIIMGAKYNDTCMSTLQFLSSLGNQ